MPDPPFGPVLATDGAVPRPNRGPLPSPFVVDAPRDGGVTQRGPFEDDRPNELPLRSPAPLPSPRGAMPPPVGAVERIIGPRPPPDEKPLPIEPPMRGPDENLGPDENRGPAENRGPPPNDRGPESPLPPPIPPPRGAAEAIDVAKSNPRMETSEASDTRRQALMVISSDKSRSATGRVPSQTAEVPAAEAGRYGSRQHSTHFVGLSRPFFATARTIVPA
jgi:hypothetical protein